MKLVEIHIVMNDIEVKVPIGDFRDELKQHIGSVATMFSQRSFESRFDTAVARVVQKIRDKRMP